MSNIKKDYSGLSSKTYLTRTLLNKIFDRELTTEEIDDMILSGTLIKKFSYYQPSEALLRELDIIPNSVKIQEIYFGTLAKKSAFVLKEIAEIFGDCNSDTARLIACKYFYKKHNYFYKNDLLNELLLEGCTEVGV